ncbi:hypothetical protein F5X98DRAFT_350427 [Xylaria grammica]|nr:hypothetical protein F5X98DRAFT_350427 [Xylaria grammica]
MSSFRGLSLLRATRTPPPSHFPSSHHLLGPSSIISRISPSSPSPSPLHHIQHGRRSFHWQSAASAAIEGAQALIVDLHTVTHLPWFMTIPLAAFSVGVVFRLPVSIYTQRILQRRTEVNPLLQAWNSRIQFDVANEGIPYSSHLSVVKERQDKAMKRIYRKLGLQQWRLWSGVLSFPFWLLAIDGLRRLCGGPRGFIGSLVTGSGGPSESPAAAGVGAASSLPGADLSTLDPAVLSIAEAAHRAAVVDPSLTYEGCLWFTDLSASDPYHILPFALSAALVRNLLPKSGGTFLDRVHIALGRRPKSKRAQLLAEDEKIGLRERAYSTFRGGLFLFATLVGPITLDLPAALHLYWLTTAMTNTLFMKVLQRLMPVKGKLVERCTGNELNVIKPLRWQK